MSDQSRKVGVVIPCYRVRDKLRSVVESLPDWIDVIIVVDDACPEKSFEVLNVDSGDARIILLRHESNQGVGGAMMTGFRRALQEECDIIAKMDGDGQMDPARLPALLEPISRGEADYVKGNRFLHTRELVQMPLLRRLGNIGLSFMTKLASGYWAIFDPNNGYIAIHSAVARLLDFERIHKRFFFESSVLLELGLHRAVVRDVYMPAQYSDEKSTLSEQRAFFEFPPLLFKGFLRRLLIQYFVRDFNAVSLFVIAGLCAAFFGLIWGCYHWALSASNGVPASTGTIMIAVLPLILGLQLLLQALVMDVQTAPSDPLQPSDAAASSGTNSHRGF